MRRIAVLAAGVLACAALAPGVATAPAQAAVTGEVSSVTVDPGPFAVDGVSSVDAAISVTASDTRGAIGDCDLATWGSSRSGRVRVTLQRESGDLSETADVDLLAHATSAGVETWTGAWRLASTRDGFWMVSRVWWCVGTSSYSVDPRDGGTVAALQVVGTRAPTATFTRIPAVAAYGARQWMQVTYRWSSGRPLRGYPVAYGSGDACGATSQGNALLSTDRYGRVTVRLRGTFTAPTPTCLYVTSLGGFPSATATTLFSSALTRYDYFQLVSAKVRTTSLRAGTCVLIRGYVLPGSTMTHFLYVRFQQLVGRSWRTGYAQNTSQGSGYYSMNFCPTARGTYRVRVAGYDPQGSLAPTASAVLTLVAR